MVMDDMDGDEPPPDADDKTFEAWMEGIAKRKKIGVAELRRRIEEALARGDVFSTPNAFARGGYTVVHKSAKGKKGVRYQITWMDDDGPVGDTEPATVKAAAERVWEDLDGAQRSAVVGDGIEHKRSRRAVRDLVRERHGRGWKATVTGGLADGRSASEFDLDALMRGTVVELEHTSDAAVAMRIAMDHLVEDPAYYEKLAAIENPRDALLAW